MPAETSHRVIAGNQKLHARPWQNTTVPSRAPTLSHRKNPKKAFQPHPQMQPRAEQFPTGKIQWSFKLFDRDASWGSEPGRNAPFREISHRLKQYESMPWTQVLTQSRKRDHAMKVGDLCKHAQDRISQLRIDDDMLWRFRFSGTERLWGVRRGDVFFVVWWDPDHEVCPSHLRNT